MVVPSASLLVPLTDVAPEQICEATTGAAGKGVIVTVTTVE